MLEVDLIILDFDDTLTLTHDPAYRLENEIAIHLGHSPISKKQHLKNWGKPLDEAVPERYPGIDLDEFKKLHPTVLKRMVQAEEIDQISPENLAALDELIKRGKKLAILTSRTTQEAEHLLDPNHVINSRVERFYHKDNSAFHKPDSRVFDQILQDFQIAADRAVYIGDAVSDAQAAKGAGLYFIAVMESGHRQRRDFRRLKVDFFVQKFSDCPQVIR